MNPANQPASLESISESIIAHLTKHLARTQPDFNEPIHTDMSFDYIGLDSMSRVELVSELAKRWSVELDLTAAYDFITVGALAEFVHEELSRRAA